MTDSELLSAYAETGSEAAFGDLVRRHLNLVYSASTRQCYGREHLAQEVCQSVFLQLSRKAKVLAKHPSLRGWLFVATRHVSSQLLRGEQRRLVRETKAHAMSESPDTAAIQWEHIKPLLDEALVRLSDADREALFLRYFDNLSYEDVGLRFRIGEDAARHRIGKALERARLQLARRGVTSTATMLGAVLSTRTVEAAPPELAPSILRAALATSLPPTAGSLGSLLALKSAVLSGPFLAALGLSVLIAGGLGVYCERASSAADEARVEASLSVSRALARIRSFKAHEAGVSATSLAKGGTSLAGSNSLDDAQLAQLRLIDRWKRQRNLAQSFLYFQSFKKEHHITDEAQEKLFAGLEAFEAKGDELAEAAQAAGVTVENDPTLQAEAQKLAAQWHADVVALLGTETASALSAYASSLRSSDSNSERLGESQWVTNMVSGIAVTSGTPLSADDRHALGQLLYKYTPDYPPGQDSEANTLDWGNILAEAPKQLSPAAFAAVQAYGGEVRMDTLEDAAEAAAKKAK